MPDGIKRTECERRLSVRTSKDHHPDLIPVAAAQISISPLVLEKPSHAHGRCYLRLSKRHPNDWSAQKGWARTSGRRLPGPAHVQVRRRPWRKQRLKSEYT